MASEFDFRLTEKAEEDLDEIVNYITIELSNPQAATAFLDKLDTAINEACCFPDRGSPLNNDFLEDSGIRKKIIGNYIMYYLPDIAEEIIYVLRVLYCGRNMDEILFQLDL